jgi:hypothetical protein
MPHYILKIPVRLENMEPLKRRFQVVPKVFDAGGVEVASNYDGSFVIGVDDGGNGSGTLEVQITLTRDQDLAIAKRYRVELWVWDTTPTAVPFDPINPGPPRFTTDTFRAVTVEQDVDPSKPVNLVIEGNLEATPFHPKGAHNPVMPLDV